MALTSADGKTSTQIGGERIHLDGAGLALSPGYSGNFPAIVPGESARSLLAFFCVTGTKVISAGAVVQMLHTLGFRDIQVSEHTQRHQFGHVADAPYDDIEMYTVVGSRA